MYSEEIEDLLRKSKVKVGDFVAIEKNGNTMEGTIMPNTGDPGILVVKLTSGYNMGLTSDIKIKKLDKEMKKKKPFKYEHDKSKKTILILHTGGTIASKIHYETGAVHPALTPADIVSSIPQLGDLVNVKAEVVSQIWSDDIKSDHWMLYAKKMAEEHSRYDGIILTMGTDTIHYTSAALALMLHNIPKPVLVVGAQRSSDRGSSDATMNLVCAAQFIINGGFAGVGVCMHENMNDDYCLIHPGLHVRKMHTSRRDSFRSIDKMPIARVNMEGHIEYIEKIQQGKTFRPTIVFDNRVALVKLYPGFDYKQLEYYEQNGYRGVILEGTGLGQAPINSVDEFTKDHKKLLDAMRRMSKKMIVAMTSQCIYGKVNMNVYSTGRLILDAGVVPVSMTPETALVKLGWSLGQEKDLERAKKLFLEDVAGEFVDRVDPRAFLN